MVAPLHFVQRMGYWNSTKIMFALHSLASEGSVVDNLTCIGGDQRAGTSQFDPGPLEDMDAADPFEGTTTVGLSVFLNPI